MSRGTVLRLSGKLKKIRFIGGTTSISFREGCVSDWGEFFFDLYAPEYNDAEAVLEAAQLKIADRMVRVEAADADIRADGIAVRIVNVQKDGD